MSVTISLPFPGLSVRLAGTALGAAAALSFSSCSGGGKVEPEKPENARVEELTGAHTRVVWVRNVADKSDMFTVGARLQLMRYDSKEGGGPKPLLEEIRNYSRPVITPDGAAVVYTERPVTKQANARIFHVDWATLKRTELRPGYAVDVWRDPQGAVWVYALRAAYDLGTHLPVGGPLIRFPLDDPQRESVVFDHTLLNVDNVQLNRAGTRASGLLPWPNAGVLDLTAGKFLKSQQGCWASMCPDDSNLSWVFDGAHQSLHLSAPGHSAPWRVSISGMDGITTEALYHPRWSNHPRVIAFTGPHPPAMDKGARGANIILGKLNAACTALETSLTIKDPDGLDDYFPDVWVEGGETVSLDAANLGPVETRGAAPAPEAAPAAEWPVGREGLLFDWLSADAKQEIPVGTPPRASAVTPVRGGRFSPHYGMLMDGGWFTPDAAGARGFLAAAFVGVWSFEAAITPLAGAEEPEGVILHAGKNVVISQKRAALLVRQGEKTWRADGALPAGATTHVALSSAPGGGPPSLILNGAATPLQEAGAGDSAAGASAARDGMAFGAYADGSSGWHGWLEGVVLRGNVTPPAVAEASARWWRERTAARAAIPRTVVEATLLKAGARGTPESIGPYSRAWTAGLYEMKTLLSGPAPAAKTFTAAHWTILDKTPIPGGPPGAEGATVRLELEPFDQHPEMTGENGNADVCPDGLPDYLDAGRVGVR